MLVCIARNEAMPQHCHQLLTTKPGFDPKAVHVGFVVYTVHWDKTFYIHLSASINCHPSVLN